MTKIKIYTEEQVMKAYLSKPTQYGSIEKQIEEMFTPIKLPSDEDIREERLLQFPDSEYSNRANDRLAFYCGAKWVINKIQGGNK